ncbi:type II toxin-antitoxin system HicB family antitoxin [candidate division KSB1 bacterium]
MNVAIKFEAILPFKIEQKGKMFISSCPIFDVFSQGESLDEAKDNLADALSLFFISCFERGTLDDVLKECGLKPLRKRIKKQPVIDPDHFLNIPIPFGISKEQAACLA